jgi:hypothetical protein
MYCIYKMVQGIINRAEKSVGYVDKWTGVSNREECFKSELNKRVEFFLGSMSDDIYLDLIRKKIQFLIDEGMKYSEQLEIINRESGRNIDYNTYTDFIKVFILENPKNIFQVRGFHRQVKDNSNLYKFPEESSSKQEEEKIYSHNYSKGSFGEDFSSATEEKRESRKLSKLETVIYETSNRDVKPLERPTGVKLPEDRDDLSFQHEAMPNVEKLY